MTREIDISHASPTGKPRRPWAVALLSGATFGVYWAVWYYKINCEMRAYGASRGDQALGSSRPIRSLLAFVACPVLLVAPIVSFVRAVGRLRRVEELASGRGKSGAGLIVLLVGGNVACLARPGHGLPLAVGVLGSVACLIASALIQARLNAAWRADGLKDAAPARMELAVPPEAARAVIGGPAGAGAGVAVLTMRASASRDRAIAGGGSGRVAGNVQI